MDIYSYDDRLLPKMVLNIDGNIGVVRVKSEKDYKYDSVFHLELKNENSNLLFHAENIYDPESIFLRSSFTFETVKESDESFVIEGTSFYSGSPREYRSHQPIYLSTFVRLVVKMLNRYYDIYGQVKYYSIEQDEIDDYLQKTFFYEGKYDVETMLGYFYYSEEVFLCRAAKSSKLHIQSSSLSFPRIIRGFKWLEELSLLQSILAQIPEEVTNLVNLKRLMIKLPLCNQLPLSIAKLKNLELLHIEGTMINLLNDGVFELVNLKELYMNNNFWFDNIPKSISRLRELEVITIRLGSKYEMTQLMNNRDKSEAVSVYDLRITEIPEELTFLPKLKKLSLEGHNIKTVPASLFEMESLEEVNLLHNNRLEREEVYSVFMKSSGRDRIKLII